MGKKRGSGQTQPWEAGQQHQLGLPPMQKSMKQVMPLLGEQQPGDMPPDAKSMVQVNPGLQPQMAQPQMSPFQMRRQGYAQAGQHPVMARLFQNYWGR